MLRWLRAGIESAIIVFIGLVWSWDIGPHGENPHGMLFYLLREFTPLNPSEFKLLGPFAFALPYSMAFVGILAWLGNWWMIGKQEFKLTAVKIIATSALIAFPALTAWNHYWYEKNHDWERFHDERTKTPLKIVEPAARCVHKDIIDKYDEYSPARLVYQGREITCYRVDGSLLRQFNEYVK